MIGVINDQLVYISRQVPYGKVLCTLQRCYCYECEEGLSVLRLDFNPYSSYVTAGGYH
jgi:hypothetical protein